MKHRATLAGLLLAAGLLAAGPARADDAGLAAIRERERLLAAFERDGAGALPALTAALDSDLPLPRRTAAHLLVRLGRPARAGIERALANPDFQVRRIAMHGLAELGLFDEYWSVVLRDENPSLQRETRLLFFPDHLPADPAARDAFLAPFAEAYRAGGPATREHVVRMLATVTPLAGEARRLLRSATRDEAETIRRIAFPVIVEPTIARLRELAGERKWREMIDEFGDEEIAGWPVTPARDIGSAESAPELAEAARLRAQAWRQLGEGAKAAADLELAGSHGSPRFRAAALAMLGEVYLNALAEPDRAVDAYARAVAAGAGGARTIGPLLAAARILRDQGRREQALEMLEPHARDSQVEAMIRQLRGE